MSKALCLLVLLLILLQSFLGDDSIEFDNIPKHHIQPKNNANRSDNETGSPENNVRQRREVPHGWVHRLQRNARLHLADIVAALREEVADDGMDGLSRLVAFMQELVVGIGGQHHLGCLFACGEVEEKKEEKEMVGKDMIVKRKTAFTELIER